MKFKDKKITLLKGGISAEREVSLRTGAAVANGLRVLGCTVAEIDVIGRDFALPADDSVIFICLHGTFGEDGELQERLEHEKRIFTGADSLGCRNAFDKLKSKELFLRHGVPTPKGGIWNPGEAFSIPCVLKPVAEGSSVGLSLVRTEAEWPAAVEQARQSGRQMMAEEMIAGREVTVGILGDEALPLIEIRPKTGCFDYEHKYTAGMTEHICPAPMDAEVTRRVQMAALAAHRALGCTVYSRVDVMVRPDGSPVVLEVNTIPGMTEVSLLPEAAKAAGLDFTQLCGRILELSLEARS